MNKKHEGIIIPLTINYDPDQVIGELKITEEGRKIIEKIVDISEINFSYRETKDGKRELILAALTQSNKHKK